jgi:hypothetical protein
MLVEGCGNVNLTRPEDYNENSSRSILRPPPIQTKPMKTTELLQSLADANVQYVLVGGLAVQLHGFMRATFDIDLVLAMNNANLERFIEVAQKFNLTPGIPVPLESLKNAAQIDQWHREKGMLAFSLREQKVAGSVVDVLVRPEITFERLTTNAVTGELFGRRVMIASIDDLLAMKRIANRPKDQLDIVALEMIKRGEDPNA